jgi:hypothetical protein
MRSLRIALLLGTLAAILLASSALAMASANYRLDWYLPMTGGGFHNRQSATFILSGTYGQTGILSLTSSQYRGQLGFWGGIVQSVIEPPEYFVQLPVVFKH